MVDLLTSEAFHLKSDLLYMKKLFLPLLASLGMIAGFTLTSCGGGGGDADTGNPNFTGKKMVAQYGSSTYSVTFGERIAGDAYEAVVSDYVGTQESSVTISLVGIKTDDEKKKKIKSCSMWVSPNSFDRDRKQAFYYMISGLDVSNSAIQMITFNGNGVRGDYTKTGGDAGAGTVRWTAQMTYETKLDNSVNTTDQDIDRTDNVVTFR